MLYIMHVIFYNHEYDERKHTYIILYTEIKLLICIRSFQPGCKKLIPAVGAVKLLQIQINHNTYYFSQFKKKIYFMKYITRVFNIAIRITLFI